MPPPAICVPNSSFASRLRSGETSEWRADDGLFGPVGDLFDFELTYDSMRKVDSIFTPNVLTLMQENFPLPAGNGASAFWNYWQSVAIMAVVERGEHAGCFCP